MRRAQAMSTSRRRPADAESATLRHVRCCGCCPNCSRSCPRSAMSTMPKFVFFFDEAHLLFDDASKALVDKIEQVVRLIRSKGVGVISLPRTRSMCLNGAGPARQSCPACLACLHAQGSIDQKAVKTAAETFRRTRRSMRRKPFRNWASARRWSPSRRHPWRAQCRSSDA